MAGLKELRDRLTFLRSSPKNRSKKGETIEGVFVCAEDCGSTNSNKSIDSESTYESCQSSWKSSGSKEYNKNVPIIVTDSDDASKIEDVALELGRIMARSRQLPTTSYFSSNHVMVNQERSRRVAAPLTRSPELDEIAREHAAKMASSSTVFHAEISELQSKLNRPFRRLGENVKRGDCIRSIHAHMMATVSERNNILDRRYTQMGMGTALGSDGKLYLCQIFRG